MILKTLTCIVMHFFLSTGLCPSTVFSSALTSSSSSDCMPHACRGALDDGSSFIQFVSSVRRCTPVSWWWKTSSTCTEDFINLLLIYVLTQAQVKFNNQRKVSLSKQLYKTYGSKSEGSRKTLIDNIH